MWVASQALFAISLIATGVLGLATGNFVSFWQPVPRGLPASEALAYLVAIFCLAAGAGLLWRRGATTASRASAAALLLWMILFRLPVIVAAPAAAVSYESWGECAVMLASAWLVHARCATGEVRQPFRFAISARGVRVARSIFGLALIAFGVAHFAYAQDTAALVPSWLPAHTGWVYVTAITYVTAGAAVLLGMAARMATMLAAVQMSLFTVLVWIPVVAKGHAELAEWSELLDSWALAAGAWVVAASYHPAESRGA